MMMWAHHHQHHHSDEVDGAGHERCPMAEAYRLHTGFERVEDDDHGPVS